MVAAAAAEAIAAAGKQPQAPWASGQTLNPKPFSFASGLPETAETLIFLSRLLCIERFRV